MSGLQGQRYGQQYDPTTGGYSSGGAYGGGGYGGYRVYRRQKGGLITGIIGGIVGGG